MAKQTSLPPAIPEILNRPDFLEAWADWLDERATVMKNPVSPRAAKLQLRDLEDLARAGGVKAAIASIEQSIKRGYTGLFPPKEDPTKPPAAAYHKPIEEKANAQPSARFLRQLEEQSGTKIGGS